MCIRDSIKSKLMSPFLRTSRRDFTKSLKQEKEKQAKREQWTGCHSGEVLSSSSHERTGQVSDLVV